jgi:hypothetical protein
MNKETKGNYEIKKKVNEKAYNYIDNDFTIK